MMHCPLPYCQAERGPVPVSMYCIGGFFVMPIGRATADVIGFDLSRTDGTAGFHLHENVLLTMPADGVSPWRKPMVYFRCFRMVYRMLRHGMTAKDAYEWRAR